MQVPPTPPLPRSSQHGNWGQTPWPLSWLGNLTGLAGLWLPLRQAEPPGDNTFQACPTGRGRSKVHGVAGPSWSL